MNRAGFVALVGWTNVGKSTLLNRLVGEKVAAVADVPQTTRNRIVGARYLPDRGQAVFVDTPGFHRPRYRMNVNMVKTARDSLRGVDLCVLVTDAHRGLGPGDEETARLLDPSSLVVLNKIDLLPQKQALLPMIETVVSGWGLSEAVPVSALTGEGCDRLLERLFERLPEGPPLYDPDFLTDQPERALAAEWIREKLLRRTRQEVPHSTAVVIDQWSERQDGLVSIEASILVDRDSQKGIVIGKGGAMLRQVGSEARADLERLLDTRVFLKLWVKVRPGWRDDERVLRDLGI